MSKSNNRSGAGVMGNVADKPILGIGGKFRYSQTYLFKLHKLTNELDALFDVVLRKQAGFNLAQFTLLLAVDELENANQVQIARYLGISQAAASRRIEIAQAKGWIEVASATDRRNRSVALTRRGRSAIKVGFKATDSLARQIFVRHDEQAGLMAHIDQLLKQTAAKL